MFLRIQTIAWLLTEQLKRHQLADFLQALNCLISPNNTVLATQTQITS